MMIEDYDSGLGRDQRTLMANPRMSRNENHSPEPNELESYNDILAADWQMSHPKKPPKTIPKSGYKDARSQEPRDMMEAVVQEERQRLSGAQGSNLYGSSPGSQNKDGYYSSLNYSSERQEREHLEGQGYGEDYEDYQEKNEDELGNEHYMGPEEVGESVSMKFAQEFVNRMSGGQKEFGSHNQTRVKGVRAVGNSEKKQNGGTQKQLYGSGKKEPKKIERPSTAPMVSKAAGPKSANKIPQGPKEIQPSATRGTIGDKKKVKEISDALYRKPIGNVREIQPEKYPFKPQVNHDLPKDIYPSKVVERKEKIVDRLYENRRDKEQERERLRLEQEKERMSECTFQPKLKNSISGSIKYSSELSVPDRLYQEGMEKKRQLEVRKREASDTECFSFKPDISSSKNFLKGEKAFQKPIYERYMEEQRRKMENIQKMKSKYSQEDSMTFQPKISELSDALGRERNERAGHNVTERLLKDASEKIYKNHRLVEEHEHHLSSICTFTPVINPSSLLENDEIYGKNSRDFLMRQEEMAERAREKKMKMKEDAQRNECSFNPKINEVSKFLAEADPRRGKENVEDLCQRLSGKDQQRKEMKYEQLNSAYYSQFDFRPEINPISAALARNRTIEELASDAETRKHIRAMQEQSEREKLRECSFQPAINNKPQYSHAQSKYAPDAISDGLQLEMFEKQLRIDHQKKLKEYEEMKECTFKPKKISNEESLGSREVEAAHFVRGLDKHLQWMDRQRRMQMEAKAREEKLFHIEQQYDLKSHKEKTVPKPFNLNKVSNARKEEKIREYLEEEKKKYPFKPETNYGKKPQAARVVD